MRRRALTYGAITGIYPYMADPICICIALRSAARSATDAYDAALAPTGLKVTMYRLLKNVAAEDGVSISVLAERLGLDRSTLGRNLRVLEKRGLVRLGAADDGRARAVRITETGRAAYLSARPYWCEAQATMRARLGGAETERLLADLAAIRDG